MCQALRDYRTRCDSSSLSFVLSDNTKQRRRITGERGEKKNKIYIYNRMGEKIYLSQMCQALP